MTTPGGASQELLPEDGSARLLPTFMAPSEADELLSCLIDLVPWETTRIPMFGREITEPRKSAWIADTGVTYRYSGRDRTVHAWPPALSDLRDRVSGAADSRFNGVLVNLYRDGRDHMGWHADDERSLGENPVIASVSLGAERRLDFRHRLTGCTVSVVLPHGSLLIMAGPVQRLWKHRIPKMTKLHSARVNLTFRLLR